MANLSQAVKVHTLPLQRNLPSPLTVAVGPLEYPMACLHRCGKFRCACGESFDMFLHNDAHIFNGLV